MVKQLLIGALTALLVTGLATKALAFCLWWMEPCDGGLCFWCW